MYLLDGASQSKLMRLCPSGDLTETPQLIAHKELPDVLVPVYGLALRTLGVVFNMYLPMVGQGTGSAPLPAQIRALASKQW